MAIGVFVRSKPLVTFCLLGTAYGGNESLGWMLDEGKKKECIARMDPSLSFVEQARATEIAVAKGEAAWPLRRQKSRGEVIPEVVPDKDKSGKPVPFLFSSEQMGNVVMTLDVAEGGANMTIMGSQQDIPFLGTKGHPRLPLFVSS